MLMVAAAVLGAAVSCSTERVADTAPRPAAQAEILAQIEGPLDTAPGADGRLVSLGGGVFRDGSDQD